MILSQSCKIRCDGCRILRRVPNTRQLAQQLTDGEVSALSKLPGVFSPPPYPQLPNKAGTNLKNTSSPDKSKHSMSECTHPSPSQIYNCPTLFHSILYWMTQPHTLRIKRSHQAETSFPPPTLSTAVLYTMLSQANFSIKKKIFF